MTESKDVADEARTKTMVATLVGGVAHDLNNLMTITKACCDVLHMERQLDDAAQAVVSQIGTVTERATQLTAQLLALSRRQTLERRIANLDQLVRDAEDILRRLLGERVRLITALDSNRDSILIAPGQIDQILMNLVKNARDAMSAAGTLTVETASVIVKKATATRTAVRPRRYVRLTVRDTGCGIPAQIRERIFEPFFTTKGPGKGVGLGLATVENLVAQNGGYIEVDSEPGRGTTFNIYLPSACDVTATVQPQLEKKGELAALAS